MHNPGKSGAKLYLRWDDPNLETIDLLIFALLSVDKMYVIKTMTTEEIEEMHHLLKQVSSQDVWIIILLRTIVTYPVNLP